MNDNIKQKILCLFGLHDNKIFGTDGMCMCLSCKKLLGYNTKRDNQTNVLNKTISDKLIEQKMMKMVDDQTQLNNIIKYFK